MRTCNDIFTLEELNTLLNAEERAIKKKSDFRDNSAMAMVLQGSFKLNNNQGRGRGGHQRVRGRNSSFNSGFHNGSSSFGSNTNQLSGSRSQPQFKPNNPDQIQSQQNQFYQTNRPQCQICGKNGHIALDCYHLMNFAYQGKHAPAKLASNSMAAAANSATGSTWLTDRLLRPCHSGLITA